MHGNSTAVHALINSLIILITVKRPRQWYDAPTWPNYCHTWLDHFIQVNVSRCCIL